MHPASIAFLSHRGRPSGKGEMPSRPQHRDLVPPACPQIAPKCMGLPCHNTMEGRVTISGFGSRFLSDRLAVRDWTIAPGHAASRSRGGHLDPPRAIAR
jgi:hypothetical protein